MGRDAAPDRVAAVRTRTVPGVASVNDGAAGWNLDWNGLRVATRTLEADFRGYWLTSQAVAAGDHGQATAGLAVVRECVGEIADLVVVAER